jgi:hypothetical protein
MEQRFTFDQIASVYRASRPDYPEALVDDALAYAGLKPADASGGRLRNGPGNEELRDAGFADRRD